MRRLLLPEVLAGVLALGMVFPISAQDSGLIATGEMAPNFSLPGATRYGLLKEPIRLSDYRGETVVLAFFFRVRTPG
jgi:hypothetical protein